MILDETLVEKTKSSDKQAFEELVRRYRDVVYFTIKRIYSNSLDVEDILQEVFISAFVNIEQFDSSKATFKTWLFSIVKSRCIDSFRRSKTRLSLTDELISEINVRRDQGLEDGFSAIETEQVLKNALLGLSEEQRLCLVLKTIGGLSYEEIAKIAEVPVGTVKSRISSARRSLAKEIFHPLEGDASCNVIK